MKKKKPAYLLVPLLLLALFIAYYWNFSAGYEHKQDEIAAKAKQEREDKLAEDNRLRLKAIQDAIAAQDQRKIERKAKADKQHREEQELKDAIAARNRLGDQEEKDLDSVQRLTKEIRTEKEEIAKIAEDKKSQAAELDFLEINSKKAQSNARDLTAVLDKIMAADAAYNAAAAARAAAAAAAHP